MTQSLVCLLLTDHIFLEITKCTFTQSRHITIKGLTRAANIGPFVRFLVVPLYQYIFRVGKKEMQHSYNYAQFYKHLTWLYQMALHICFLGSCSTEVLSSRRIVKSLYIKLLMSEGLRQNSPYKTYLLGSLEQVQIIIAPLGVEHFIIKMITILF